MPGRVEELYKMHLIIAPRWMREINGFPFSEPTVLFLFYSHPSKPQFVATALLHRATPASTAFTLSSYALVNLPIGRAGNEGDTWIRDYIAAMKSNLSIHSTMDLFDTTTAISHFLWVKSFQRADPFVSEKRSVPVFVAFNVRRWKLCFLPREMNIWKLLKLLIHYKNN